LADRLSKAQRIPQAPGALRRERLLELLSAGLERKITLISAPPGYGKTTLASQLALELAQHPVIWQTIGEQDRAVAWLYTRARAAIADVLGPRDDLPEPKGYTAAELAAFIADALRGQRGERVIYICDDVQYVTETDAGQTYLRRLVDLLPGNVHLVLVSREMPRLRYADLIAHDQIVAVGAEELRLTVEEAAELALKLAPVQPTLKQLTKIVEGLEGWPAGVMMALRPPPTALQQALLGGAGGPTALFNALATAMLDAQPAPLRQFLLDASTLREMSPALCSEALGLNDPMGRLREAQDRNLFVFSVQGGMTFHSLFRAFLQARLRHSSPARHTELHARAAAWFETQGEIDRALEHYLAAGMAAPAAALAERLAPSFDAQDRVETLLDWNDRLRAAAAAAPTLAYICARGLMDRYQYDQAAAELDRAEAAFHSAGDQVGTGKVIVRRAALDILRGQIEHAAQVLEASLPDLPDTDNVRGRGLGTLGKALLHKGAVDRSLEVLSLALPLYRADGDLAALSHVLQDMVIAYFRLGDLDNAGACLQEYVALRRSLGGAGTLATALNNLGYYYHQRGQYRRADETLREGLTAIARVSDRRTESYLMWSLADLQRDLGNFDSAWRLYERALVVNAEDEPVLRISALIGASILRRWQGLPAEAVELAGEALALSEAHHAGAEATIAQAALLASQVYVRSAASLLPELEQAITVLRDAGLRTELVGVLANAAHVALLAGDAARSDALLDEAQQLAQATGGWQALVVEVAYTPALKEQAAGHAHRYAELLRQVAALAEASAEMSDQSGIDAAEVTAKRTYTLRIFALGEERVERDGVRLNASDWTAVTAKELFFYLLFNSPVTREQASLEFWPDADPQKVRSNFHTTLWRARQAVGEDVILHNGERYLINPDVRIWCDAFEVEELARQGRPLPPRDARAEDLWSQAAALYGGEFLPGIYQNWADVRRRAFEDLYVESLLSLSECARSRKDFREALRWLGRAMEAEPLSEDVHRALMITYSQMGEKHRVAGQYETLTRLLRRELGTSPSEETVSLARLLLD